jgi:hypothetical protein
VSTSNETMLICPFCGWKYRPREYQPALSPHEFVPHHPYPQPGGSWCPGTEQHPRNPETDRRRLWKDGGEP